MLDSLIISALSGGIVASVLVWLTKTWLSERLKQSIQNEYATLLELHKASLKGAADIKLAELQAQLAANNAQSLEHLRANIQVAASNRQVRWKYVYDREVEAISETYQDIFDLRSRVSAYVTRLETPSLGTRDQRREHVDAALSKFQERFRLHRLYLPSKLAKSIDLFVRQVGTKALEFSHLVDVKGAKPDRETTEIWREIDGFMDNDASQIFVELEAEFRRRLGQHDRSDANPSEV